MLHVVGLQHLIEQANVAFLLFGDHVVRSALGQFVDLGLEPRPRYDADVRAEHSSDGHDALRHRRIVVRHDEHFGPVNAGQAERVLPGIVAAKDGHLVALGVVGPARD